MLRQCGSPLPLALPTGDIQTTAAGFGTLTPRQYHLVQKGQEGCLSSPVGARERDVGPEDPMEQEPAW